MTTFFGNCKASRRLKISTLFFMSFPTDVNRALSVYCSVYMGSGKCIPDVSVNVETSPLPFVELVSKPQVQLSEPMSLQGGCWPRSLASCPPLLPPPSTYLQHEATAIRVPARTPRPRLILQIISSTSFFCQNVSAVMSR